MTRVELVEALEIALLYAESFLAREVCPRCEHERCRAKHADLKRLRAVLAEARADLARAERARKEAEREADQLQPCPTCRCYILPTRPCVCCEMRATVVEPDT